MQIGIGLPSTIPGAQGRLIVDWARRAEERGFSTVATIDRVAYPSHDSLISLAAAGAATERIALLTNILLAPTRNPVLLAKEAASVDQISAGRLTLGIGVGGRQDDFEATERSFGDRGRRLDRDLETMHRAWRGELLEGATNVVAPKPAQGDRVPILIGGMSERAIDRTVRWGIGWTAGGAPIDASASFMARVREAWSAAGRDGRPRIVCLAYYSLGEGTEAESVSNLRDYYGYLGDMADRVAGAALRTPEALREAVAAYSELGVDEFVLDPTVADLAQVDLLADAVL